MRIRDLTWKGLAVWPPAWSDPERSEEGALKDVRLQTSGQTELIAIDAENGKGIHRGIILLEPPEDLEKLYQKLLENLGLPLKVVGDLEIDI